MWFVSGAEYATFFFQGTPFSLERKNWQTMVIQTWVFGRYFLKNEQRKNLSFQRKQMTAFVANVKIGAFKWKLEFWKTFIWHWEPDSLPIHYDFSQEINGDINKCDFWMLYNKICQNLENLHNNVLIFSKWSMNDGTKSIQRARSIKSSLIWFMIPHWN